MPRLGLRAGVGASLNYNSHCLIRQQRFDALCLALVCMCPPHSAREGLQSLSTYSLAGPLRKDDRRSKCLYSTIPLFVSFGPPFMCLVVRVGLPGLIPMASPPCCAVG